MKETVQFIVSMEISYSDDVPRDTPINQLRKQFKIVGGGHHYGYHMTNVKEHIKRAKRI